MAEDFIRDFPEYPDDRTVEKKFVPVGRTTDVPPGRSKRYIVSGLPVAIFNVSGRYLACKDRCPHMAAALTQGRLEGEIVICWQHGWRINLIDGTCPEKDWARAEIYQVRQVGEVLEVELPLPSSPGGV